MKTLLIRGLVLLLAGCLPLSIPAQETKEKPPQKTTEQSARSMPVLIQPGSYSYNPEGRRDPFRDLLAGRDVTKTGEGGLSAMSIDDVVLIGITKYKGKFTAIINGPGGFPIKINVGNRFEDGFVLSINDSKVVFRKTKERGVTMFRPKDITKEINPEER